MRNIENEVIETTIEITDLKVESRDSVITDLIEHKVIEPIEGVNFIHGDIDLEVDCEFIARPVPYVAATGPSFENAGGDPPEGGYCEDEVLYIVCPDGYEIDITEYVNSNTIEALSEEAYVQWKEDRREE